MNPFVQAYLDPVAKNRLRSRFWRETAMLWSLLTGLVCITYLLSIHSSWQVSLSRTTVLILSIAGFSLILWRNRRRVIDYKLHAEEVEKENTDLNAALLTAIEQEPNTQSGRYSYLQERVLDFVLAHGRVHFWGQNSVVRLLGVQTVHLLALVCLATCTILLLPVKGLDKGELILVDGVEITPGHTEIERGKTLVVMARFRENQVPVNVDLEVDYGNGVTERIPMQRGLNDPVYGGSVKSIQHNFTYRILYTDSESPNFAVDVFEYPALVKSDATLDYPDYTGLEDRTIADTRTVSAVEGTSLTFSLEFNKPLSSVHLSTRDGETMDLEADPENEYRYVTTLQLDKPARFKHYEVHVKDSEGRGNRSPEKLVVNVTPNNKPITRLNFPRGDQRVSALEEMQFEYEIHDDYGVLSSGVSYTISDEPEVWLSGTESLPAGEKGIGKLMIKLEDHAASPDQLITWNLWSVDIGPDGMSRTNVGDLYFAEVQPFEEIFRESAGGAAAQQQQSAQMEGGAGGQAGELAEIQKQIISANWNLRREKPEAYLEDLQVVIDSQEQALSQLEELKERASQDPEMTQPLKSAEEGMKASRDAMTEGLTSNSTLPLGDAIASSRKAYQALLELAAREFEVSQNNDANQQQQQQGGGSARNRMFDQQLEELDLSENQDRYVRENTPPSLASQNNETSQLSDQLSRIAQRQQDLVEKLRELQASLNAAETEEEKEEIERQLKRLRDEQRRIMEDIDESSSQLSNQQNTESNRGMEQQLDQARENANQTREQLEQGDVPGAIASGSRAGEELQATSNQLRNQSSSQFAESMRQVRDQSRELIEQAEQTEQDLQELERQNRNALSDTPEMQELRSQVDENLQQQKAELSELLDSVRNVIESAESTEPLLANRLYDTMRSTDPEQMQEALEESRKWLQRNLLTQAGEFNQIAVDSLETLHEGIENAARGILGDDVEALKQARRQVSTLMEDLDQETQEGLSRQEPDPAQTAATGENQNSENASDGQPSPSTNDVPSENPSPGNGDALAQNQGNNPPPSQGQNGQGGQGPNQDPNSPQNPQSDTGDNQQESQLQSLANSFLDALRNQTGQNGGGGGGGPITGTDFTAWADQWNEIEQMIDLPDLRNEAARIGELVREMRADFRRDGKEPQWDLVKLQVLEPMDRLKESLSQEIVRRESPDSMVPIDRDPVPSQFQNLVQEYYKRLGGN